MNRFFSERAWEDYLYWQATDKTILKKVNVLLKEIERTQYKGMGKPEALKYNFSGFWSRRINLEQRLIYKIEDSTIIVMQCRYHT